jgi:hypothetical protein
MASLGTPLEGGPVCREVTEKIPVLGRLARKKEVMIVIMVSDEDGHKGVKTRID